MLVQIDKGQVITCRVKYCFVVEKSVIANFDVQQVGKFVCA